MRNNKVSLSLAALLGLVGIRVNAQSTFHHNTNDILGAEVTDRLIKNGVFVLDRDTKVLRFDRIRLLSTLKNEIANKIKNKNISNDQRQILENTLMNLKPESFGVVNEGADNLMSMDFGKSDQ